MVWPAYLPTNMGLVRRCSFLLFWPRRRLKSPCSNKSPVLPERMLNRSSNRRRIVQFRLAHIFSAAADAIISTPATNISSKLKQPF